MTEKEVLRGPKTFCLNSEEESVICLGCDAEMEKGSFYLADSKSPSDISEYSLVEGSVCPACAAKRIKSIGTKTFLVSFVFAAIMLLGAWVITGFLKPYIMAIYLPVMVVMIAAAVIFVITGIAVAIKRAAEAKKVLSSDNFDELLMNEFAADDNRKRFYSLEPTIKE
ncbi:MAG: hypothetical protein IJF27_02990 [Oscillospiraceae bacterium]|nr:hypothetical protein [Oscillospiraceae bacterium]MBQ9939206.1 hypothetical protein [Oscillospiraceae bacterium]